MRGAKLDNFFANNLVKASVDSRFVLIKWLGVTIIMLCVLFLYGIERAFFKTVKSLKTSDADNMLSPERGVQLAE